MRTTVSLLLFLSVACGGAVTGDGVGSSQDDVSLDELIAQLPETAEGHYLWGDIVLFDRAEVEILHRELYPRRGGLARWSPAYGIHPDVRGQITYCIARTFSPEMWSYLRSEIPAALEQWSRHVRDLRFVYRPELDATCESATDVVLSFLPNTISNDCGGWGRLPLLSDSAPRLFAWIGLADRVCLSDAWMRHLVIHEVGHNLGFAHEHQRVDTPEGCDYTGQATDATDYLTPEWDVQSVMNYGRCNRHVNGHISQLDVGGSQALYGVCENWRTEPMHRPPIGADGQPVAPFDYDGSGAVERRYLGVFAGGEACSCGWEAAEPDCGAWGAWRCGGGAGCSSSRVDQRQECR